ncbi:MAG: AmmeMemoRadiSam system protein B [bacterium]|nr:AmmeMemoRadiSam system protein B [bacterium]
MIHRWQVIILSLAGFLLLRAANFTSPLALNNRQAAAKESRAAAGGAVGKAAVAQSTTTSKASPEASSRFYPPDPLTLRLIIQRLLSAASGAKVRGRIFGLICPHHGYLSSGIVAAAGYKQLTLPIKRVFILGPVHQKGKVSGAFIPAIKSYRTPLGEIPLSSIAAKLSQQPGFVAPPKGEATDRSIEMQLPFLQQTVKSFELVPILVGQKVEPTTLARQILPYLTEECLIIASSDLSEGYPFDQASSVDQKTIKAITSFDFKTLSSSEACGRASIATLMEIARQKQWSPQLIEYQNSGYTTRARKQVAGFACLAFCGGEKVGGEKLAPQASKNLKTK